MKEAKGPSPCFQVKELTGGAKGTLPLGHLERYPTYRENDGRMDAREVDRDR